MPERVTLELGCSGIVVFACCRANLISPLWRRLQEKPAPFFYFSEHRYARILLECARERREHYEQTPDPSFRHAEAA
jgi:hypothetical protein